MVDFVTVKSLFSRLVLRIKFDYVYKAFGIYMVKSKKIQLLVLLYNVEK